MNPKFLIIVGILIFAVMGIFFILSVMNFNDYLSYLEKESKLSAGSSSPYCPSCFLHASQNYEIIGIVLGIIGILILGIGMKKQL